MALEGAREVPGGPEPAAPPEAALSVPVPARAAAAPPLAALVGAGIPVSNAAVARWTVQRQHDAAPAAPAAPPPAAPAAADPLMESPDPGVNGKPVSQVGQDVAERDRRYRELTTKMKDSATEFQRSEHEWYDKLDLVRDFIDLFNQASRTDPARWDGIKTSFDTVATEFDGVLAVTVTPETINAFGKQSHDAMEHFNAAFQLSQEQSAAFSDYLSGFAHSASNVHDVAVIVRDVSFAAAVSVAVVIVAPAALAGATAAAGSVGLSGTTATVAAYSGTAVSMGMLGAGMEGGGRELIALMVQGGTLLDDLLVKGKTWNQAVDAFDWTLVEKEGVEGMKRGFVDGVLAYAGLGLDKALGAGTGVALNKILGAEGAGVLSQMLRRALQRAIAGGVGGGIIGGLDAGIRAATEGRSVGAVGKAMEEGFALGAAAGAVLGGGAGVFEERAKARLAAEIAEMTELIATNPEEFARRYQKLVASLTPEQRAAWDTEMKGRRFVDKAHYDPAAAAHASGASPTPPAERYGAQMFKDWSEAAAVLDEHARSGAPLSLAEVEGAHEAAARNIKTAAPGEVRSPANQSGDLIAGGGLGPGGIFSALTPEQIAILETNPHLRLLVRGGADGALTAEQAAARMQTAVIVYPDAASVESRLTEYFTWYQSARSGMDPTAFAAEAQRRFVSIHPFLDGNGRVSRLVMDHALQSKGLPPALLENPSLDYMIAESAWVLEVRKGVLEAYNTTVRHADLFNRLLTAGDAVRAATVWGSVIGLTDDRETLLKWLYPEAGMSQ